MMTLQDKKENLIQMEWQQFYQVHNEGGRASCQEDPKTFAIMRRSQFTAWPEALVDSYTADLEAAEEVGRNLLTEKYAWMMEDYAEKYPRLAAGNRAIRAAEATPGETSFETYLRGELHTYSEDTLLLYRDMIRSLKAQGVNMSLLIMEANVKAYGYQSLEDAEKRLKK